MSKIIFDGVSIPTVATDELTYNLRLKETVLLDGKLYIQSIDRYTPRFKFSGVLPNWAKVTEIRAKLGDKGELVAPNIGSVSDCYITSFSTKKMRGSNTKYRYDITFVTEQTWL